MLKLYSRVLVPSALQQVLLSTAKSISIATSSFIRTCVMRPSPTYSHYDTTRVNSLSQKKIAFLKEQPTHLSIRNTHDGINTICNTNTNTSNGTRQCRHPRSRLCLISHSRQSRCNGWSNGCNGRIFIDIQLQSKTRTNNCESTYTHK